MILPVDWRTSLSFDDDIIQTITPSTIQSIRKKVNLGAIDILYYTSPVFREQIENLLSSELNRLYKLFCQKNQYFKRKFNKVSIVAHSLGKLPVNKMTFLINYLNLFIIRSCHCV